MNNTSVKLVYLPIRTDDNITVTRDRRVHMPIAKRKPTWWQTLKRQATEDGVTVTLITICVFMLAAVFAAQAGIHWNF